MAREAVRIRPSSEEAYMRLALSLVEDKNKARSVLVSRVEEARSYYRKALEIQQSKGG